MRIYTGNVITKTVDKNEAPAGYYAVSKDNFKDSEGHAKNFCSYCDLRAERKNELCPNCSNEPRSDAYSTRKDGCSVVFKKIK